MIDGIAWPLITQLELGAGLVSCDRRDRAASGPSTSVGSPQVEGRCCSGFGELASSPFTSASAGFVFGGAPCDAPCATTGVVAPKTARIVAIAMARKLE